MLLRVAFVTTLVCHWVASGHGLAVAQEPAGKGAEGLAQVDRGCYRIYG